MTIIIGYVIVFGSIVVGFAMANGNFHVLMQPAELVVIGGAAFGSLVVMAPPKLFKKIMAAIPAGFKPSPVTKEVSLETMGLLYEVFTKVKRDGALAVEPDVENPHESELFQQYPKFLENHEAVNMLCDTLRLMLMGASVEPHDLDDLMSIEIESIESAEEQVTSSLTALSEAFPGLGIVAAVLGIIVTMGHMTESPEVIGHHVAAALVGTFLGILLCYGVVGPLAKNLEFRGVAGMKLLQCIKASVLAFSKDMPPRIAVEFGRRVLMHDEKPTFTEAEQALKKS